MIQNLHSVKRQLFNENRKKRLIQTFTFLPLFLGFPIDSHIQLKNGSQIEIKNGHTVKAVPL